MSSNKPDPTYPDNHILRLYNQFPYRAYTEQRNIQGMIDYVKEIAAMNYNAVWINPLHLTGTLAHSHPDGKSEVRGSLYAMADDTAYNPVIFPDAAKAEEAIKQWTAEVRKYGMYPLFDLVLNHVGIDEGEVTTPLQEKLKGLLMAEVNERWPDIQNIDYYKSYSLAFQRDEFLKPYTIYIDKIDKQKITYTVQTNAGLSTNTVDARNLPQPLDNKIIEDNFNDFLRLIRPTGLKTRPEDLDEDKINRVFELLWTPLIQHYVNDLGFMGVRIDALSHVPIAIQQRANALIDATVQEKFATQAIKIGELMVSNPSAYADALSLCGLTHSLHPCSFYWGHNNEGGYTNQGAFSEQNRDLSKVVLGDPDKKIVLNKIVVSEQFNQENARTADTVFLYKNDKQQFVLRVHGDKGTAMWSNPIPIEKFSNNNDIQTQAAEVLSNNLQIIKLEKEIRQLREQKKANNSGNKKSHSVEQQVFLPKTDNNSDQAIEKKIRALQIDIRKYQRLTSNSSKEILRELNAEQNSQIIAAALPHQSNLGGLVGVVGNHDVGTLKAKIMLDLAYSRALSNTDNRAKVENTYQEFKNLIKGIVNTSDLMERLQKAFELTDAEKNHLYLELDFRMREKIFIQALSCTGGWYSLGGDELAVCHKPEVFEEFGRSDFKVGSSLATRIAHKVPHDLRSFIAGVNKLLSHLPTPNFNDQTTIHQLVLNNEIFGSKPADFLFIVDRYDAKNNKHYLLCQAPENLSSAVLLEKLAPLFADKPWYQAADIHLVASNGDWQHYPAAIAIQEETSIKEEDDDLFNVPLKIDKKQLATDRPKNYTPKLFKPEILPRPLVEIQKEVEERKKEEIPADNSILSNTNAGRHK